MWGDKGRLRIAADLYRSVSTRSITFPMAPLGRYPIPMPDSPTRVMFVEDEATLRKSYEMFFADRYEMEFAASGAEAVTKVKPFGPEVVVLDLRLPDTDGIEVMRRVREIDPQVPVIITTAYVSMGPLVSMLALGRTSFMTKPFDLNDLARKIDEASILP